jgi:hypothetical protein
MKKANGREEPMNQRFLAYLLHNTVQPSEVKKYDYIIWIQKKASEFKKMKGVPTLSSDELHTEFTEWLFELVGHTEQISIFDLERRNR